MYMNMIQNRKNKKKNNLKIQTIKKICANIYQYIFFMPMLSQLFEAGAELQITYLEGIYMQPRGLIMPMWRNWQTHMTQNHAGNHVGSSPTIGTKSILYSFFLKFRLYCQLLYSLLSQSLVLENFTALQYFQHIVDVIL